MWLVKKFISFFIFIIFLVYLSPKQDIYFYLEKRLKEEYGVVIGNEKFSDNLFGLTITNADIFLKGANIAHIKSLKLNIFFFYNQLLIEGSTINETFDSLVPESIDKLNATFSIIKPYKVAIEASGSFGSTEGGYYIGKNKLFFRLKDIKNISPFRKFLKKDDEGLYYEKFFK